MKIEVKELLEGQATQIKEKQFPSAKKIIEPFLEVCNKWTNNFIVEVQQAPQLSINEKVHRVYNRVYIQAVLNNIGVANYKQVISMIYCLDTKTPITKMFTGGLNMSDNTLAIFNPENIIVKELEENIDYSPLNIFKDKVEDVVEKLEKMEDTYLPREEPRILTDALGSWVDRALTYSHSNPYGKIKLGTSEVVNAYKDCFIDTKSEYYIKPEEDANLFTIYNTLTNRICNNSKADIVTKPEKVLLLSNILGL